MTNRRIAVAVVCIILAAAMPAAARAQGAGRDKDGGVLVRVNGPARVGADERVGVLVVVNDNADIAGTVVRTLVLVRGTAVVTGTIDARVTVVDGTLDARDGAHVNGNVTLVNSTLNQTPGAAVTGNVQHRSQASFGGIGRALSFFFWLAFSIVVLVAGLLFAAVAGRQLRGAGTLLSDHIGPSLLGAVVVWIALPILAVLAFVTVAGIGLGISIFLFLLPALWFLGYLVTGARLGAALLRLAKQPAEGDHPYLSAIIGLVVLQVVALIPVVGGLVAGIAGLIGAGALALLAWRAFLGRGIPPPTVRSPI